MQESVKVDLCIDMKRVVVIIILCLLSINFTNCMGINHRKYDWSPTVCAPKNYPVKLVSGVFVLPDKKGCSLRGAACDNEGWGEMGGGVLSNEMPAPIVLDITWLSFAENKYYAGTFDLPQKKIDSLFATGYIDASTKKHQTYNLMIVGMAPGGVCVVWLTGSWGTQVEIGRYQAKETQLTLSDWMDPLMYWASLPDQKQAQIDYVASTLQYEKGVVEHLKEHGITLWLVGCLSGKILLASPNGL